MSTATRAAVSASPTSPQRVSTPTETEVPGLLSHAHAALAEWHRLDQRDVNAIVEAAALAAARSARNLAEHAVAETGRGNVPDKVTKNLFASRTIAQNLRGRRTVGIITSDRHTGITLIAEPAGVVAALTPVTNPTSTVIFKALLCLKTRNAVVFSFHPAAQRCSAEAAAIVRDAAIRAGAPRHCIQWIASPSMATTNELMRSPGTDLILATGGNAMVHAAYSSGTPAIGVGAGNVPAYLHRSADVNQAVRDVVTSKSFDNGMICAAEQVLIVDDAAWEACLESLGTHGVHVVDSAGKAALERLAFQTTAGAPGCANARLRPDIVGKNAPTLAARAGLDVHPGTRVLAAVLDGVGPQEPLSREKLCPILSLVRVPSTEEGIETAERTLRLGGMGHTAVVHARDRDVVTEFARRVPAVRVLENTPAALGAIGGILNALTPSLTLGCGTYGGTSVSDNISVGNLLNIKHLARPTSPAR